MQNMKDRRKQWRADYNKAIL